jgi:hypothetical protein
MSYSPARKRRIRRPLLKKEQPAFSAHVYIISYICPSRRHGDGLAANYTRTDKMTSNKSSPQSGNEPAAAGGMARSNSHLPTPISSTEGDTDGDSRSLEVEMIDGRPKDEYDRFTPSQKKRMTAIVSFSALISRQSCQVHRQCITDD